MNVEDLFSLLLMYLCIQGRIKIHLITSLIMALLNTIPGNWTVGSHKPAQAIFDTLLVLAHSRNSIHGHYLSFVKEQKIEVD